MDVTLNVGGEIFSLNSSLIVNLKEDSLLMKKILQGKIQNKSVFFDRDSTHFRIILDIIQAKYESLKDFVTSTSDFHIIKQIKQEFSYYGIEQKEMDILLNMIANKNYISLASNRTQISSIYVRANLTSPSLSLSPSSSLSSSSLSSSSSFSSPCLLRSFFQGSNVVFNCIKDCYTPSSSITFSDLTGIDVVNSSTIVDKKLKNNYRNQPFTHNESGDRKVVMDASSLGPTALGNLSSQIFLKTRLTKVVMTTLLYDASFVENLFPKNVPVYLICPRHHILSSSPAPSSGPSLAKDITAETALPMQSNITVIGVNRGIMHGKLWILFYTSHVRIVIHSANCKYMDWDGMLENFWYQDFPLASSSSSSSSSSFFRETAAAAAAVSKNSYGESSHSCSIGDTENGEEMNLHHQESQMREENHDRSNDHVFNLPPSKKFNAGVSTEGSTIDVSNNKNNGSNDNNVKSTSFAFDLKRFISSMCLPLEVFNDDDWMHDYDFSLAKVDLVYSIPGIFSHFEDNEDDNNTHCDTDSFDNNKYNSHDVDNNINNNNNNNDNINKTFKDNTCDPNKNIDTSLSQTRLRKLIHRTNCMLSRRRNRRIGEDDYEMNMDNNHNDSHAMQGVVDVNEDDDRGTSVLIQTSNIGKIVNSWYDLVRMNLTGTLKIERDVLDSDIGDSSPVSLNFPPSSSTSSSSNIINNHAGDVYMPSDRGGENDQEEEDNMMDIDSNISSNQSTSYNMIQGRNLSNNPTNNDDHDKENPYIKLIYPSKNTVLRSPWSQYGWYFWCNTPVQTLDKSIFHSTHPQYPGALLHSKVYAGVDNDSLNVRWVMAGSQNMSLSAWGGNNAQSSSVLSLSNYEIGVFMSSANCSKEKNVLNDIDFPFELDPKAYEPNENVWIDNKKKK